MYPPKKCHELLKIATPPSYQSGGLVLGCSHPRGCPKGNPLGRISEPILTGLQYDAPTNNHGFQHGRIAKLLNITPISLWFMILLTN
jgi:hypothetical protein